MSPRTARRIRRLSASAARHAILSCASLVVLVPIAYVLIASLKSIPEIFGNPYGLSRRERPLAMVLYTMFVGGMLIPVQMIVLPLFILMRDLGLLGTLLSLIFPYTAMGLPIGVLVLTPLIATLPRDLGDAGRIDGATEWQIFLRVVLPVIRPGIASVMILNGVWMWNEFFMPLVLAIKPDTQPLPVGIVSFVGMYSTEWGLIFASVVIATAPAVIAYVLMARQFVKGMTAGAVKG
jgi:raffinose/stachyose/melibiose transport system permease protein